MIVNDLKDHVLCSKCRRFGYGVGPYQCKRGHMICPRCQPSTNVCPQCFIFVDVTDPIRCHSTVDFLMDKVPVPCIYKDNGCMEKDQRGKIREHVFVCPFRNQANVVDATEGIGTAEAGTSVSGVGSRCSEDDAETVIVEDMNNQDEETKGVAGGRGSEDDAETVTAADINDQNEVTVGGTGGHDSEDDAGKAVPEDTNEETVGIGSVDIRNEHTYEEIVLSDDDAQNEENVGGAVFIGTEDETEEDEIMDGRNVEQVRGSEGPVPANTDDENMEAEDDQNQEAFGGDGVKGDNDRVVLPEDDEVDIKMENESDDDRMEEEENSDGSWIVEDDEWIDEDDLGSFLPLGERKSTRKRKQPLRYSPIAFETKATYAEKVKTEENTKIHTPTPHTHNTRLRTNYDKEQLESKVVTEAVHVDSFECTFCGQKFRQRPKVTKHLSSYHAEPVTERIGETEKVYRCCMFCDSRFIRKDDLREHISNMHNDKY